MKVCYRPEIFEPIVGRTAAAGCEIRGGICKNNVVRRLPCDSGRREDGGRTATKDQKSGLDGPKPSACFAILLFQMSVFAANDIQYQFDPKLS